MHPLATPRSVHGTISTHIDCQLRSEMRLGSNMGSSGGSTEGHIRHLAGAGVRTPPVDQPDFLAFLVLPLTGCAKSAVLITSFCGSRWTLVGIVGKPTIAGYRPKMSTLGHG